MNQDFSSEQVYDAISGAANSFFGNLTGSVYWRNKQTEVVSGSYDISGIQINFKIREFMRPDGTPVLPQSQINPEWLSAGSYFGIVEVNIPHEPKFSIQSPHNKPENQVHLQKGREKILLPPPAESIENYGVLGSSLFLKFDSKGEVINKIQEIREK